MPSKSRRPDTLAGNMFYGMFFGLSALLQSVEAKSEVRTELEMLAIVLKLDSNSCIPFCKREI